MTSTVTNTPTLQCQEAVVVMMAMAMPDNPPDNSSDMMTSNIKQNFGANNPEDDLNNVPLAFKPFAQLTDAIRNLTREALQWKQNTNGPKTKVREPDPFNRSNPKKL